MSVGSSGGSDFKLPQGVELTSLLLPWPDLWLTQFTALSLPCLAPPSSCLIPLPKCPDKCFRRLHRVLCLYEEGQGQAS